MKYHAKNQILPTDMDDMQLQVLNNLDRNAHQFNMNTNTEDFKLTRRNWTPKEDDICPKLG